MMTATHQPLDADTLDLLQTSLRHVLTDESDRPLAARLAELGWDDVVEQDAATSLRTLFEIKGDTLSPADALGASLSRRLHELTGDDLTVALPSPYGPTTGGGNVLHVEAMLTSAPGTGPIAVPVDGRLAVCVVDGLTITALDGIDDTLPSQRVTGSTSAARWIAAPVWDQLVAHGRWLLACELVGIARHVVAGAVEYTKQRVQYGKPIGTFQALQHRLAAAHSMVVGASHLAIEAGADADVAGTEWTAMVAKCMAGQAAEFACTQAQQCYGAIGFTWEHEFHRSLRRTYALDRMLGDWRTLEHEIGTRLQQSGEVPRIGSL